MRNVLMIIVDGLGDEHIEELNGTPLAYASSNLENLNKMAEEGICGCHWPVAPGVPPSSGKAHLSVFGYDIEKYRVGRGIFEALGADISLKSGDVALRTNFGTVEESNAGFTVVDRRAGRIEGSEAEELGKEIKKAAEQLDEEVEFRHTVEHRGVLVIRGDNVSWKISDLDPHQIGEPVLASQPLADVEGKERKSAENTCETLKKAFKAFHQVLKDHQINQKRRKRGEKPANALLMRGAASLIDIPSFKEKWGMKASYTAEAALYKGVAKFIGMEPMSVEEILDFSAENERKRINKALNLLQKDKDFVFLHVKLADNFSHSKKPRKKAEFLKNLDRSLEPILEQENILLLLTGDHASSSTRGRHMGLPVPILYWGGPPRDRCEKFTEKDIEEKGGLGFIRGRDLMPVALDLSDRAEELGIRSHPSLPPYKRRGGKIIETS